MALGELNITRTPYRQLDKEDLKDAGLVKENPDGSGEELGPQDETLSRHEIIEKVDAPAKKSTPKKAPKEQE